MDILTSINTITGNIILYIPNIIMAVIVLIMGFILGKIISSMICTILKKLKLDKTLKGSVIEKTVEASGTTILGLFGVIVRWFIYLIAIMLAVEYLNIPILSNIIRQFIEYLPHVFAALLILLVGLIIADFIGDTFKNLGKSMELSYMNILSSGLKLFLYFFVLVIALEQLGLDVWIIYVFADALAWGVAVGIGLGIGIGLGFGLKDRAPELVDSFLEGEIFKKIKNSK